MMTKNRVDGSRREPFYEGGPLTLVSICLDSDTLALVTQFVESAPGLQLQAQLDDYPSETQDSVLNWSGDSGPDICLIDFDQDRASATLAAERIHAKVHGMAIFAVSSDVQPDLIIQAMRCGCSEYIIKPVDRDNLLGAVTRASGRRREKKEQYNAQILSFTGSKGGSGVTMLATALGSLLAKSYSRKVLLIDFHPEGGDAGLFLGQMSHRYHFFELLENTYRLDGELLQSFLIHHSSGLDVLPAPEASDPVKNILLDALGQTFDFLRFRYEFILVDLPPGCGENNLEMLRYSDQIYLITVAEVPAIRNAARYLEYLSATHHLEDRIRVVLNRHLKRSPITEDQIEKAIRRGIYWKVPNHYAQVMATINAGDPTAGLSRSEVMQSLTRWADNLSGKQETVNKKKGGILGLWNQ